MMKMLLYNIVEDVILVLMMSFICSELVRSFDNTDEDVTIFYYSNIVELQKKL